MRLRAALVLILGCFAVSAGLKAAEYSADRALLDAEETYELRLERILSTKGRDAMVQFLARELAERPRPYVKAWYANYLLYGVEFGMKDLSDPKRGFALAKEARQEGSLFGLELVGRAWGDGRGTPFRDSLEALKCLREAAERGRASAMAEVAKYYFFGQGVPCDRSLAEDWARKAGRRGAAIGLASLADWWDDPKWSGTPDHAKSLALRYECGELGSFGSRKLLEDLATKGDPIAQKYVKLAYVAGSMEGAVAYPAQLRKAVKWLEANAADDPTVQLTIAELMLRLRGPVFDPSGARTKLTRLADGGNDDARAVLAEMAWKGIGETKDEARAVAIWRELADRGNARALNWIGWLHWWGNGASYGVAKDPAAAFELCRRAADLGYWRAQENTANAYAEGVGTEVNYYLAGKYYGILVRRGYIEAITMRDRILALVKD